MTPLVLWSTQTFALAVAAHLLLLSTATDTQTDARRKPTRQQQQQQQHRKPTPSDVDDALPRLFPPPPSASSSSSSPSQQTTAASPNPPGGNRSSAGHQPLEPWGTGNVWTRNDGGRTTRRSSHGGGRKLRRNETTVEKNPFTASVTPSPSPSSSPSPSPPALRSTERRVAPPSGIQDGGKNASKHASIAHGHHQKSVTGRVEFSPRQKTSSEPSPPPPTPPPTPSTPPSPSPSLPGVVGVGKEGGAVPCREACDTSLCPQVAAEACRGRVVKDDCQCCPVCTAQPPTTTTNQSKGDFFGPQQKPPSNACDGMVCEKNKVCILNIQGIPMCRCRNIYICRSAERRPICTVNGTFKNKCFVQVEECTTGKRIRVVHRGACRARSPVRQVKPYL